MTLLEHLDDIDVCDDPEWTTAFPYQWLVPGFGVGVLLPEGFRWRSSASTTGHCTRWATSTPSRVPR